MRGAGDLHTGLDIAAPLGTPVLAVLPGEVVDTWTDGELGRYGNTVLVAHSPDWFSLYAHLQAIAVRPGQRVDAGATVGSVGTSAAEKGAAPGTTPTSSPHLHLEFMDNPRRLGQPDQGRADPSQVLSFLGVRAVHRRRLEGLPDTAASCDDVPTRVELAPGRIEVVRGDPVPPLPAPPATSATSSPPRWVSMPAGPEDELGPWLWLLAAIELGRDKRRN